MEIVVSSQQGKREIYFLSWISSLQSNKVNDSIQLKGVTKISVNNPINIYFKKTGPIFGIISPTVLRYIVNLIIYTVSNICSWGDMGMGGRGGGGGGKNLYLTNTGSEEKTKHDIPTVAPALLPVSNRQSLMGIIKSCSC